MKMTPEQCRIARELIGWSRTRLGAKAMISESTIRDFELGRRLRSVQSTSRLQEALETAGVTFTEVGVMLDWDRS